MYSIPQPADSTEELLLQGLPPTHLFETLAMHDWRRHWSMKTPGRNAWEVYSQKGAQWSMSTAETSPDALIRADTRQPRGLLMSLNQL